MTGGSSIVARLMAFFDGPDSGPGQVIRYIQVPPRKVMIEVPVSVPADVPPETQQRAVEIPGYVMTERWTLQQPGAGVYRWQRVPSSFQRK